jgi:hypothetical protein
MHPDGTFLSTGAQKNVVPDQDIDLPDFGSPSVIDFQLAVSQLSETFEGGTTLATCCQCGDGPRVLNIAPACVECGHALCEDCVQYKS